MCNCRALIPSCSFRSVWPTLMSGFALALVSTFAPAQVMVLVTAFLLVLVCTLAVALVFESVSVSPFGVYNVVGSNDRFSVCVCVSVNISVAVDVIVGVCVQVCAGVHSFRSFLSSKCKMIMFQLGYLKKNISLRFISLY